MRLSLCTIFLLCVPTAPARAAGDAIPYEKAAREYVARHGFDAAKAGEIALDDLLAKNFVHGRFGMFEVWFPVAALETRAEDLKKSVEALVDGHGQWLEWLEPIGKDTKAVRADHKVLAEWVGSWKPANLAKERDVAGKDLLAVCEASEAVSQASARFGTAVAKGEPLGVSLAKAEPTRLFLLPTRKDFVEFLCYVGLSRPEHRAKFWAEGMTEWTQCFVDKDQAIALEYAAPNRKAGDYETGMPMNGRNPTTMQQQVVQLAMNSLFDHFYEGRVPAAFTQGLSMNLVIDQFGEIHTRVDGDVRSRVTGATEVFVPGGIDGGVLPTNSAETAWREDHGKDHFIRVLRLAQKDGDDLEKKSKNRAACFRLLADDTVKRTAVVAPFLGQAASKTVVPPDEFKPDFEELMRAYKSGFMHWLQTKGSGNENNSRARFAKMLASLADPKRKSGFEAVFAEHYEKAPLSAPDLSKDTLEGRFLLWLTKQ
jgi:hypothetical protein